MPGLYWLMILAVLGLSLLASAKVKMAFSKWKRVGNSSGLSGAEAAAAMLSRAGLSGVRIEQTRGFLSDHYDPRSRTLRLSPDVYAGRSVASAGIALHEAGHALQHAQTYGPLALRSALVPVVSIGSGYLPILLIFVGLGLGHIGLAYLGLACFAASFIFSVVTLPVEYNASARAKQAAVEYGIVAPGREAQGVAAVLDAAALTYVAAAVSALLTLLYYATIVFGANRD